MGKNKIIEDIMSRLREMRLPAMIEELHLLIESGELEKLSSEEILERLTASEVSSRKNNTIDRLKKKANFSQRTANLLEIDYSTERQLNKKLISQLSTTTYIEKRRNIIILGACGTGKSYFANALGINACDNCYSTVYVRLFELLNEMHQENMINGVISRSLKKYSKVKVLILDDFLIHKISEKEVTYLFKLLEYRYENGSTIICSQLEPAEWHKHLGGSILADSILDRLLPRSYTLVISGNSMREREEK